MNIGENENNIFSGQWDGTTERRSFNRDNAMQSGDFFQYKYVFFEKFNSLEKKVSEIEKSVDEIKISFIRLQTKIMVVSGLSGVVSAGIITSVLTSLADKFIK